MYQDGHNEKQAAMSNFMKHNAVCAGQSQKDKPEVLAALDSLRDVVQRYDCLVGRMSDRLNCVVTAAPPIPTGKEERGYQTKLASEINEVRCQIRNITDALESLCDRIEL